MSEHGDIVRDSERDMEDMKRRAGELCVQFVLLEDRCEALEAANVRLKAALRLMLGQWGEAECEDDFDREAVEAAEAALASGSEGNAA